MFLTVTLSLVKGLGTLLELFALTLLFSLPLGLIISFGSMSKWQPFRFLTYRQEDLRGFTAKLAALRPISAVTNVLVWIIRGTPLMLQLIIIFYGPGLWFDNNIWGSGNGRMTACVVAFVINYACYFSVIFPAAALKESPWVSVRPARYWV